MPAVQFKRCSFPSSHFLLRRTDALMRLKLLRRSRGSLYESRNPACKRIPVETDAKLVEFAEFGVPVIFDQQIPEDVPGLNNVKSTFV